MQQPNAGDDLVRIHRAITRGLRVAADTSGAYSRSGVPAPELMDGFARYVQALISLLDAHHLGEEEVAWPYAQEKHVDAPYDVLMAQHAEMAKLLDACGTAFDARDLSGFHGHTTALEAIWLPHIGIEEDVFSSAVWMAILTPDEQTALSIRLAQHGQQHAEPGPLTMPFVLYNLDKDDRAAMAAALPPELITQLIPGPWMAMWGPMKPFLLE